MVNKPLVPPDNSNYRYGQKTALKVAGEKLAIMNIKEQCRRTGADYKIVNGKETAELKYLNVSYSITFPEMEVVSIEDWKPAPQRDRLLIIHYFLIAAGSPLTGKSITFKELPGGTIYFPTFHKRAIEPLLNNFGIKPDKLLVASKGMGGIKVDYGDVAVRIHALCHVPLILVLWYGDDEFAATGSILFDSSIDKYLPTEDITVLCEIIAWRLVKAFNVLED